VHLSHFRTSLLVSVIELFLINGVIGERCDSVIQYLARIKHLGFNVQKISGDLRGSPSHFPVSQFFMSNGEFCTNDL
jgi:hypothetical protein